ncbi:sulfatase family protein [Pedobacter frigoris]|uniref:Sulfatase n=1 Tax=Pedobacter frigoris TaxID=2571272 RepID=A0A4U1CI23_9SPHI|nr:sulfatase [Pedobacter frigoris]TKC06091.1 sulfatase [Pedobacter frigoris]
MMHKEIKIVCAALLCTAGFSFKSPVKDRPPNIIFIMADDLTMGDIGPYGSTQVYTPNLTRLAKEGVCLDNMFNMVPVCSPTRQSLLTGLGPVRNGAYPNHTMIYDGIKTLPVYLKELGYRAALIGKKHYAPESAFPFEYLGGRDGDMGYGKDVELSKAEDYIRKSKGKPYFLMFTSNQPHEPWNRGNQKAYDPAKIKLNPNMVDTRTTRSRMAKYFAEITYLDSLVGVCLDMVDRSGEKDNTVVIFATEQGNSFPFSKWTLYDQGLRSGIIARWPGKIKPGTRNAAMLQYSDITPTLIDIAGADPLKVNTGSKDGMENMGFDGRSFKNILTGSGSHVRDYVFAEMTTRGLIRGSEAYGIRSARSNKFLYIHNLNYKSEFQNTLTNSVLFREWMTTNYERANFYLKRPEEEFYDVIKDPFNLYNLAADPEYAVAKKELQEKLSDFMKQQNDKGLATEMDALSRQPKNQTKH